MLKIKNNFRSRSVICAKILFDNFGTLRGISLYKNLEVLKCIR